MDKDEKGRNPLQSLAYIGFGLLSVLVGLNMAGSMFITFAPANPTGFLPGESEAIERIRSFYTPEIILASGVLVVFGIRLFGSGWRQLPRRGNDGTNHS